MGKRRGKPPCLPFGRRPTTLTNFPMVGIPTSFTSENIGVTCLAQFVDATNIALTRVGAIVRRRGVIHRARFNSATICPTAVAPSTLLALRLELGAGIVAGWVDVDNA